MKKLLFIPLIYCILLIGCSEANDSVEKLSSNTNIETSKNTSYSDTKVTLSPDSNIINSRKQNFTFDNTDSFYTKFISIGQLLFFADENNNNKLSVTSLSLNSDYIEDKNINSNYDHSVESLTTIDSIVYFTSITENNNLYRLDYEKNSISLVSGNSFSKICASSEDIIYINKNMNNSLCSYNTTTDTYVNLSTDKCGDYIVNGNYILYKNLDDNSSLYIINKDGSGRDKLTNVGVDSFCTYKNSIIYINASDNYLYLLDPLTKESQRIDLLNGYKLKYFAETFYYINQDDSNTLYSFSLNDYFQVIDKNIVANNTINDYFPIESGIFYHSGRDINKSYFSIYE